MSPMDDDTARRLTSNAGRYHVMLMSPADAPPLNEPFEMVFRVLRSQDNDAVMDPALVRVDAAMPHHRHGMVRRPTVWMPRPGVFQVRNMLLHMPGYWELYIDITEHGVTERTQWSVELQ